FAPDCIIVLGPGNSLGGAVAQSLIGIGWEGMQSKSDFVARQSEEPFLISMGLEDQRVLATG
ncbi:MAG: ACP S-malonyltransferase, partial [Pseudomonadota bacterium]